MVNRIGEKKTLKILHNIVKFVTKILIAVGVQNSRIASDNRIL